MTKEVGVRFVVGSRETWLDEADYDRLQGRTRGSLVINGDGYLVVSAKHRGNGGQQVRQVSVARLVIGAWPWETVDHINGGRLDNRRANLRLVTPEQNTWNNRQKPGRSGYLGVWVDEKYRHKYRAVVHKLKKKIVLGRFASAELAARARDLWVIQHRDSHATLNFPELREPA